MLHGENIHLTLIVNRSGISSISEKERYIYIYILHLQSSGAAGNDAGYGRQRANKEAPAVWEILLPWPFQRQKRNKKLFSLSKLEMQ